MRAHYGMPTLIECPALEQSLSLCAALGLDFIELNMSFPAYQLDRIDAEDARRLFQRYGKYPTIRLDQNLDVCDFNPAVASAYVNTVLSTIAFARKVNAPVISMRMPEGVSIALPDQRVYLFDRYNQRYLDSLRRFRDACAGAIGTSDILICVENREGYQGFQREGISLLLESACFAQAYSEIDIAEETTLDAQGSGRYVLKAGTADALRQAAEYLGSIARMEESSGSPATTSPAVTNASANERKLDLFAALFRGREDAYARRWVSKDGQKSGYAPVCRNEWVFGVCEKPRVRCADCKHRELTPLDKNVLARHLSGKEVIGVYPLLSDETCLFLAMDFDEGDWAKDVAALRRVCADHGLPIAVERSRSGDGAHVWFFFDEPISAHTARRFGSAILTSSMERRHCLKFSSYDRLFPNQDTMPNGGFGNLIALPLQREARNNGNTLFIDGNCVPYADPWAFLSGLRRLSAQEVERVSAALAKDGELGLLRDGQDDESDKPWQRGQPAVLGASDFPAQVRIVEANVLYVEKSGISVRALNRLKRLAAFQNPEFYRAQAMRLSTWDKPRIICLSDETSEYLLLPRGCKKEVESLLEGVSILWQDERNAGRHIDVRFGGVLREEQTKALAALMGSDTGILSATTAFGKTVVGAALIASRKVNTLVLVNRQPLLDQWEARLGEFLDIRETLPGLPAKRGRKKQRGVIGLLGAGKNSLGGIVDIAIIQSLVHGDGAKDVVKNYGMVIVDECHHVAAVSFERVLKETNARYVYGLTATPKRQDGHQPIITMHCGDIRYQDDAKRQAGQAV